MNNYINRWEWERADGNPLGRSESLDGWLMTRKIKGFNYVLVHLYDPLLNLPKFVIYKNLKLIH